MRQWWFVLFGLLISFVSPSSPDGVRATTLGGAQTPNISIDDISIKQDMDVSGYPAKIIEQILSGTGVPAGLAESESCSSEPTASLKVRQGVTIREALDNFVAQNRDYRWVLDGGVVDVIPRRAPALLDARVHSFQADIKEAEMGFPLFELMGLPEVQKRAAELKLKSGIWQGGLGAYEEHPEPKKPPASFHISAKDLPLREVLNSIVRAYPGAIWIYSETQQCDGEGTYILGLRPN